MSAELVYSLAPGRLDVLVFDAATSESPDATSEVTNHPIEAGADVSDHVRSLPVTLSLDVTVTDYPLSTEGRGINAGVGGSSIGTEPSPGRAEAVLVELLAIKDAAVRCTVSCGARLYTDMVLESVAAPRTKALSGARRIKLKFREVRIAVSEVVPVAMVTSRKARPTKDAGHHEGTEADAATEKKSFAERGKQAVIDFANWVIH